jgi:predicted dehydrogenase
MAQTCRDHGSRLAVNLSRRYADRYIRLKQELKKGIIGQVNHVNVVIGAGGLGCVGSHYFDLIPWLTDTLATWVVGTIDPNPALNVRGSQFFDPGGRGMVGYADGMTASFELSGQVPITCLLQLIGTQGHMEIDEWSSPTGGRVEIFQRPEERREELKTRFVPPEQVKFDVGEPLDAVLMTKGCLEDLVGDGREDTVSGGIAATDTVMAFHISNERNWQKIDLLLKGDDLLYYVPIT